MKENLLLPSNSIKRDGNSVLVLWGARHGNRNPERFLEQSPKTWGFEGEMELTCWGKCQAIGLGREIRNFVGDLCCADFYPEEVEYYSSSANRCKKTLEIASSSFHNSKITDSPSYLIDDRLLRMYSMPEDQFPMVKAVWDPITWDKLPFLAEMAKKSKKLIKYLENATQWKFIHLGILADVADNLTNMDLYQAEYPNWLKEPGFEGFSVEKLKEEILKFQEIHQIACSNYEPARNLMAAGWIAHILRQIENAVNCNGPKVVGYVSHTEIVLSAMKIMGMERNDLPSSAGFVLEFRKVPYPSVRLLNHDPNPLENHLIYQAKYSPKLQNLADKDGFLPLEDFVGHVSPVTSSVFS